MYFLIDAEYEVNDDSSQRVYFFARSNNVNEEHVDQQKFSDEFVEILKNFEKDVMDKTPEQVTPEYMAEYINKSTDNFHVVSMSIAAKLLDIMFSGFEEENKGSFFKDILEPIVKGTKFTTGEYRTILES